MIKAIQTPQKNNQFLCTMEDKRMAEKIRNPELTTKNGIKLRLNLNQKTNLAKIREKKFIELLAVEYFFLFILVIELELREIEVNYYYVI